MESYNSFEGNTRGYYALRNLMYKLGGDVSEFDGYDGVVLTCEEVRVLEQAASIVSKYVYHEVDNE